MMQANRFAWLIDWNPLTAFLTLVRQPLLSGACPPASAYGVGAATVLVAGGAAVFTLARWERKLIFRL
jgi:ABC-type polysaccharide/polyol phosphate export permease